MTLCPKLPTSCGTSLSVKNWVHTVGSGWVGSTISTDDSTVDDATDGSTSWDSLESGVLSLKRSSEFFVRDDSASDTSGGVGNAFAGGKDLAVCDVVSDDWFLHGLDDFIRLWLDHLNSLNLIRVLSDELNVLKGKWLLWDVLDVLDGERLLWDVFNVLKSDWWLWDELSVADWIGLWLYPINVLNWIRLWLHPFNFFNWVWLWDVGLVVRDGIWLLWCPLNVVNFVRWWLYPFSEFLWDWVGNDNLDVLNWDWLWLDPLSVLDGNVLDGGNWIRFLWDPFKPLHVVRLRLKPLSV